MFELKVKTRFAGAHQLTMVGQKCENLHGHNWNVEVCVQGENLNSAGVLADFGDIKKAVRQVVKGELDHKFLNELEMFEGVQPTSERIAVYIANRVQTLLNENALEKIRVSRVMAWESEDACATYLP
ncbi:MAG: 6-carboxytetrahydropterin synthase QueD [Proteobacteria bacterium]|nr:6-carboxytetrahydropterin synthase QueD [Pseudomonadota bacterium]MBU1386480.1 6-carboxytetrahydropterin synthase QueD [Pseudomonadota bacterium]MBU1544591.1 6-carboxytetrahydropterin synthase QueD [Pseudomonadota bacterium]MBU2431685.1 6-carboxytetrahydropterin synthase QueD [Pseudomonadota bacterium]MBU2481198.1 6-carboxytetrahydropterin synthase QueD [Pseudomonadota bacterium]